MMNIHMSPDTAYTLWVNALALREITPFDHNFGVPQAIIHIRLKE